MVRLLKHWMVASKQFTQFNHVVITLSHLLPINRDHIIVQPITCGCFMIAYGTLRYFTFDDAGIANPFRHHEHQIVRQDILYSSQNTLCAIQENLHPRTLPALNMFRWRFFQSAKSACFFLFLVIELLVVSSISSRIRPLNMPYGNPF